MSMQMNPDVIREREERLEAQAREREERLEEKVDGLAQATEKEERLEAQIEAGSLQ